MAEAKTLVPKLLPLRRTKKSDPHMNSGGIALRHVRDVGQFATSIPPDWNMPVAEPGKERRPALRPAPVIVTGDKTSRPLGVFLRNSRDALIDEQSTTQIVAGFPTAIFAAV